MVVKPKSIHLPTHLFLSCYKVLRGPLLNLAVLPSASSRMLHSSSEDEWKTAFSHLATWVSGGPRQETGKCGKVSGRVGFALCVYVCHVS